MKAYRVPSVPPICPKKTSPKTSAAAEPKRKKSYHSVAVPIRLAKTTLPTERPRESGPGAWTGADCVDMVVPFGCRAVGAARDGWCGCCGLVRCCGGPGSGGRPAAVEEERGAGDRGGAGAAEVADEVGDLLGVDVPLHGGAREQHLVEHLALVDAVALGLRGDLALHEGGPHVAGAHGVAGDALARCLEGDHLRQALEPVLGADIGRLVRRGTVAVDAGDVDQAAPAPVVHPGEQPPREPERRLEHDPVDQCEALGVE